MPHAKSRMSCVIVVLGASMLGCGGGGANGDVDATQDGPAVAIESPARDATLAAGDVMVFGTTTSGSSAVRVVEVSVDGGAYRAAVPVFTGDWSTWTATSMLAEGSHTITSRVTDEAGNAATDSVTGSFTKTKGP